MKKMKDLQLKGERVLIRVDYNVPVENGMVVDDFRIRASLPTIQHCLSRGASVVLMSHMGRPNGKFTQEMTLDPVSFALEDILGKEVIFSNDCISDSSVNLSQQMDPGEIHLLENLRFHKGEIDNDSSFSWFLSRHAGIYINDAFGIAHRKHASNVGITKHIHNVAAGFLIEKEKKFLCEFLANPLNPMVLILGGSKIDSKITLIENMMNRVSAILIGGEMAFTFLKAQGKNVGSSQIDKKNLETAEYILNKAEKKQVNIYLPQDVVSAKEMTSEAPFRVVSIDSMEEGEAGFDIGPETSSNFELILSTAKTIIWNGPLGVCEIPSFATGTQSIASIVRDRTKNGAISIIGGGDTAAAIKHCGIQDDFTHISTGGGASLHLLSGKIMPAFEALNNYA